MESRSLRIFLVCAMGAAIGSLAAMEWGMFWLFGVLLGGAIAYLGYDLPAVYFAMKRVTRENLKSVGTSLALILSFVVLCASAIVSAFCIPATMAWYRTGSIFSHFFINEETTAMMAGTFMLMAVMFTHHAPELTPRNWLKEAIRLSPPSVIIYHPLKWFYFLCKYLIANVPSWIMAMWKMSIDIFKLVHSELRLLCMVDAGIGAMIGYFSGSVVIGALAGGILGVINFEIISKRLLKIAK